MSLPERTENAVTAFGSCVVVSGEAGDDVCAETALAVNAERIAMSRSMGIIFRPRGFVGWKTTNFEQSTNGRNRAARYSHNQQQPVRATFLRSPQVDFTLQSTLAH
jgi:hypothetical protein